MKILIRNHKTEKWQKVNSAAYTNESELQKLLAEDPALIATDEINSQAGEMVVAFREFPLSIGSVDLLGFSAEGDIFVVECKLASNPQIKRRVIAQVLEYGAGLWGLPYEDIDQRVVVQTQMSLSEHIREEINSPDWQEEDFRETVKTNLKDGCFTLIIVVDQVNDELGRIIRYINEAGRPAFTLGALEIRRYQHNETEILVPHVFSAAPAAESGGARLKWNYERLIEDAAKKNPPEVVQLIKDLHAWTQKHSPGMRYGTGSASGSFTFVYDKGGEQGSVFSVYSSGWLTVNFGYMEKIFNREQIEDFRARLAAIPVLAEISSSQNYYFNSLLKNWVGKGAELERFKGELLALRKSIEEAICI